MQKIGRSLRNALGWIGINYAVLVVLLVSIELLGQLAFKVYTGKFVIEIFAPPKNWIFEEHPYLAACSKKDVRVESEGIAFTIDPQGFRITSKNPFAMPTPKAYTIVCLGGSTTFGTHVDDSESWPYLLQDTLGSTYKVYNLGTPGYSTLEALIQLSTVVPDLKPDLVIFYQGWNDIHNYHTYPKSPLYEWHGAISKKGLFAAPPTIFQWYEGLFLWRFSKRIGRNLTQWISPPTPKPTYEEIDPYFDKIYARNLTTLDVLTHHLNAQALFIPQVINKDYFLESPQDSSDWSPTLKNKALPSLMDHFNQVMIESLHKRQTNVIKNVGMNPYTWKKSDFMDEGHFSPQGNKKFCNLILPYVLTLTHKPTNP